MNGEKDDDEFGPTKIVRPAPASAGTPRLRPEPMPGPAPSVVGAHAPAASAPALPGSALEEFAGCSDNPLIRAATPLLVLASQLRGSANAADPKQIQQRAVAEIRAFEERARAQGCTGIEVNTARYLLCTFLDESVMSTPWGEQSGWRQRSLLIIFYGETYGGEKFFQILDRVDPARHAHLLELIYVCLSLGFEGKYRVEERGIDRLAELRRDLYNRIAEQRARPEPELSPHWRGVRDTRSPIVRHLPAWVAVVAAASLVLAAFLWFYIALGNQAAPIEERLSSIGLSSDINIKPEAAEPAPAPAPPAAPPPPTLKQLLAQDEAAGLLTVDESADRDVVTVSGASFKSASAEISDQYMETLRHIGAALERVPGRVLVIGHTDDTPVKSMRYGNNFELSRARALAFVQVIGASMHQPSRLEWSGVGASQPKCTPVELPASRACNRRVEIVHLRGN